MATAVPPERFVATARNIITSKRSCLSDDKLDKLFFLQTVNKKFGGIELYFTLTINLRFVCTISFLSMDFAVLINHWQLQIRYKLVRPN